MKTLLILLFILFAGYLSAQPPTSNFVTTNPNCVGDTVVITYTGNGTISDTYNWIIPPQATPSTLTGQGPHVIIFSATGTFQVGLSVTGTGGTSDTTYVGVLITMLKSICCTVPFPDAGPDQTVCGYSAIMSANQPTPGNTTLWSLDSGPVGGLASFSDSASPTTEVNVNLQGTYFFRWTEADGMCDSTDYVSITFYSLQTALTLVDPADSINCGRNTDILVAQEPTYGVGFWYDSIPLTQFYPNNYNDNPDSTVISGSSYGIHKFYWVTVNGNCRDTSDAVPIHFYQKPVANAGGNYWPGLFGPNSHVKTDTTNGLTYTLNAIPSLGYGMWFSLNPSNVYGFTLYPSNPDTVAFYNYTYSNYDTFIWLEDNHSCVDKDTLFIYVQPASSVSEKNVNIYFLIFPNPMTTSATISIPNIKSEARNPKSETGSGSDFDIQISDLTGKVVRIETPAPDRHPELVSGSSHAPTRVVINRGNLNPGVYIIEINGYCTKLIVE